MSIIISPDNRYAYLIFTEEIDSKRQFEFYACPIQIDGKFNHNSCHIRKLNFVGLSSLIDVAVAKNNSAIYFVHMCEHFFYVISYCPIGNSGETLGECVESKIYKVEENDSDYLNQPLGITLDNTGKYAYILYSRYGKNHLFRCRIVGTHFKDCHRELKYGWNFSAKKNIAYRSNSLDDEVNLHFKPEVESR